MSTLLIAEMLLQAQEMLENDLFMGAFNLLPHSPFLCICPYPFPSSSDGKWQEFALCPAAALGATLRSEVGLLDRTAR